jgi:hypothetical protein
MVLRNGSTGMNVHVFSTQPYASVNILTPQILNRSQQFPNPD